MRILRSIYTFITGGSIAAPIGLACAIVCALVLPAGREIAFVALIAVAFIASTIEKPA